VLDAKGAVAPFPDQQWNAWQPGQDPRTAFVNVDAIHLDDSGALWVIDTGSPQFGGDPLPGGAKLVQIDLPTRRVASVITFTADVALPGSYIDDIRFHGHTAYLTDAGKPGIVVLDLQTKTARRVLDNHSSTTAPADRTIVADGAVVRAPDGQPLRVNADPMELSPDGQWLYYAPLEGPWSQIETKLLDDPSIPPDTLAAAVRPWADLPPVGGTAMTSDGTLYFTDLAENALKRRTPDGAISTVVQDERMAWADAPFIESGHKVWLPVPQMHRVSLFNDGQPRTRWPIQLLGLDLGPTTPSGDQ